MSRIVILGGMLTAVLLCAGAATLAFETSKHRRSAPADPAVLTTYLQNLRDEIALP